MVLTEAKNVNEALDLYKDYLNSLISKNPELEEALKRGETVDKIAVNELGNALYHPDTEVLLIRHKNIIVGFVIIGQKTNSSVEDAIYIQEFYIDKKRQRKGFGRVATRLMLSKYPNRPVEFFVLKKNKGAIRFWNKMMTRNGYHDVTVENENEKNQDKKGEFCDWFCWEPAK